MRGILEAKIASLEELAGQLKGLSAMKQRIAEDAEYPPENPESFRQHALEHKHDAIAALTAAHTLKAVLAASTKAEQIALMRHYVLEFGQSASRNAKLINSLAEDDPQRETVHQNWLSDTFVVSTLNDILSDVTPERPHVSPSPAAPSTMAGRLGRVLSWIANVIAVAILSMSGVIASNDANHASAVVLVCVVIAVVIWMVGRGLRYVLAGR